MTVTGLDRLTLAGALLLTACLEHNLTGLSASRRGDRGPAPAVRRGKRSRWARLTLGAALLGGCSGEPTTPTDDTTAIPNAPNRSGVVPAEWSVTGLTAYAIGTDAAARTGTKAAFIAALGANSQAGAIMSQGFRADEYRGKRVRWSAWVRHTGVTHAAAWMRVDGYHATLAFDNMFGRQINGTSDWHQVSVVLDVGANAAGIAAGVLFTGNGDLVIDDMALDVVDSSVATTDLGTNTPRDSASVAAFYHGSRPAPVNLGFEGAPPPDAAAVTWLTNNSSSLITDAPAAPLSDLGPLGDMVGDATIVGLGEGTHGTREFFLMKHRIFRYLVEEKQFTHFAIEASWPEANRVNEYVLNGLGNPAALIRGMYFWTWDTYEVLELVDWMRQWNTTAAPERRVQFLGFDMQAPGMALDTVTAFVNRRTTANHPFMEARLACIARYRNNGNVFLRPRTEYTAQPEAVKTACRDSLADAQQFLEDNEPSLVTASSEDEYARALQSMNVVRQFEAMAASASGSGVRDSAMAENVDWLMSRAPAGTRMVLWAHNFHVARLSRTMGKHLASRHGTAYRNLGFLFGAGSFRAINSLTNRLEPISSGPALAHSMEGYFGATGHSRALLDARTLSDAGAPSILRAIRMRSIGSTYNPNAASAFYTASRFPEDYDLLIYFANAQASLPLP